MPTLELLPPLANLSQLRPPGDAADFVRLDGRPVFKQHYTADGQFIGPDQLRRICDRCNLRIVDTGDFATLVIRHTSKEHDRDPEVIGFVGPYAMGSVGRVKPTPAIMATLWVFRESAHLLKKYPRLSVEFWCDEDDPASGYFDPVSLLGAETPELDLGIQYSKDDHTGKRLRKYSKLIRFEASLPGGSNTAVPAMATAPKSKKTKSQFSKEGMSMLEASDIQQIVQALTPVVVETVQKMSQTPKSNDIPPAGVGAVPAADPAAVVDGSTPAVADQVADPTEATPYAKLCQYMEGGGDDAGGAAMYSAMSPDDQDSVRASIDGEPDQDRKMKLQKYMAAGPLDDDDNDDDEDDTDLDDEEMFSDDLPITKDDDAPTKYQKQISSLQRKYAKAVESNRKLTEERAKLTAEVVQYRRQAEVATREGRQAKRYQKLQELHAQGYVFDLAEEAEEVAEIPDAAFERHCTNIVKKYQKLATTMIPVEGSPLADGGKAKDENRASRISQAEAAVAEKRAAGKTTSFFDEYQKLGGAA